LGRSVLTGQRLSHAGHRTDSHPEQDPLDPAGSAYPNRAFSICTHD
jgi:hypothetical protein